MGGSLNVLPSVNRDSKLNANKVDRILFKIF